MTALHCLKHIIKSRPRCFLTCCTHWTELKMRSLVRNQASVPEIFEQHEGFKLQEGRETQHLCGVMSYYRLKERETWSCSCFRSVWPHYLCWWMRKLICKPSLKWCSDTNRSAGNWFTRKLQWLKTVSFVISFSCMMVWGRRR